MWYNSEMTYEEFKRLQQEGRKRKITSEQLSEWGKMGAKAREAKYGKEYYSKIRRGIKPSLEDPI